MKTRHLIRDSVASHQLAQENHSFWVLFSHMACAPHAVTRQLGFASFLEFGNFDFENHNLQEALN
jgi:hypothetical protein